jgi:hypothetical protein
MKFNSNSVLLEQDLSINRWFAIHSPPVFSRYKFCPNTLNEAVEEFNKKLDNRPNVTMQFMDSDMIHIDILRLVLATPDSFAIWLGVKEKDVDIVKVTCFTIQGDVYFVGDSDVEVNKVIIHDVLFNGKHGIFTNKTHT